MNAVNQQGIIDIAPGHPGMVRLVRNWQIMAEVYGVVTKPMHTCAAFHTHHTHFSGYCVTYCEIVNDTSMHIAWNNAIFLDVCVLKGLYQG